MNKIGGSNANLSQSLQQQRIAQQQQEATQNELRQLNRNIASAQTQNAQTIGRTVNKSEAEVKTGQQPLLDHFEVSQPALAQDSEGAEFQAGKSLPADAPQSVAIGGAGQETASPSTSPSAEALANFTETLFALQHGDKKELENIVTEAMSVDTSKLGESGQEISLAATALRTALAKLQAKMPNASKEQIREAAKTDPEIAKWAAIADAAGGYLSAMKAEGGALPPADSGRGASSEVPPAAGGQQPQNPVSDPAKSPFSLDPVTQAQMMADNVKTAEEIKNIYQQMWAEAKKAQAQRHQIMMETANAVNEIMMGIYVNRQKSSQAHFGRVLAMLREDKS